MMYRILVDVRKISLGSKRQTQLEATVTYPTDEQSLPVRDTDSVIQGSQRQKLCVTLPDGNPHPTHGLKWRHVIRGIRTMVDDNQPEQPNLNKLRTRQALCSGDGSRQASFTISLPCTVVGNYLPPDQQISPTQLELQLSAPPEYSQLDLIDALGELGQEFGAQAQAKNTGEDLDIGIFLLWLAANIAKGDQETYLVCSRELSSALLQRCQIFVLRRGQSVTSDYASLFDATSKILPQPEGVRCGLDLLFQALSFCPADHSERLELLITLTNWLLFGLPCCGLTGDFENAVEWCRQNVLPSPPEHGALLNRFGYPFMFRYESLGHIADLDAALLLLKRALDLTPRSDPLLVDHLYNLTIQARFRFSTLRYPRDREDALRYCREAISLTDSGLGTVPRGHLILELGVILGLDGNVDEGIPLLQDAVTSYDSQGDRETLLRITRIYYRSLYYRFERDRNRQDLEEASTVLIRGLEDFADNKQMRVHLMLDAVDILCNPQQDPSKSWFDKAIPLSREALEILAPYQQRHVAHASLAQACLERYDKLRELEDVEEAYENIQAAIAIVDGGYAVARAHRAQYLAILARTQLIPSTSHYDVVAGLRHIRNALDDETCGAGMRLRYTIGLFKILDPELQKEIMRTHTDELIELHFAAVRLLPQVAYIGLDHKMRLKRLHGWDKVTLDAAILCTLSDKTQEAMEILEEGKMLFWSQSLQLRTPYDQLPQEYRDRLLALFHRAEEVSQTPMIPPRGLIPEKAGMGLVGDEFPKLLAEIRALPGCESFMQPPSFETLMTAARFGPVVMLVPHEIQCVALCVLSTEKGSLDSILRPLVLRDVTLATLQKWSRQLNTNNATARSVTLSSDEEGEFAGSLRADRVGRAGGRRTTSEAVLRDTWIRVVKPIIDVLGLTPATGYDRRRLWWCPTGIFTSLPLHAAGIHVNGKGICCSDYVVSSYTPTLGWLATTTQGLQGYNMRTQDDGSVVADHLFARRRFQVLSAAVPTPFKGEPLTGVISELEAVASIIPRDCLLPLPPDQDVLVNPAASAKASTIVKLLPEATVLHLACHGVQNPESPLDSGFLMQDKMLTMADLMRLDLPNAVLAFLSACETAKGDDLLPNQSIHLCAALLFSQFKSVVGTMWPMDDRDGPRVARAIYGNIFGKWKKETSEDVNLDVVPYAVDEVSRQMRAEGLPPSRWAQYVHHGI